MIKTWMMLAAALVGWCLAVSPAAAGSLSACELDYEPARKALVLRYTETLLAIDTQEAEDGVRILVDFSRPTPIRPGAGLALCAGFAAWRQEGDRLVVTFRKPYSLTIEDDPRTRTAWLSNERAPAIGAPIAVPPVVTAAPTPAMTPAPAVAETPQPMAVAGRLPLVPVIVPDAPPVSLPSPAVSAPGAVVTAPAPLPAYAIGRRAAYAFSVSPELAMSQYQEHYPTGDVSVQAAGVIQPGVAVEGAAALAQGPEWLQGDYVGALRLGAAHYAFRDTLFPLSTHARQSWRGELSAARVVALDAFQLRAGLGYMVRWESTLHSAVAPEPSYAFAAGRLLHGPELALGGSWQPGGPGWLAGWGAVADAAFAPAVISQVDGGAGNLPWLTGLRLQLAVERTLGDHRLRVGFQRAALAGGSLYDESFQGPFISVR
jgi:hypothetical protein